MQKEAIKIIQEKLANLADEKYRSFQCRLMPTVPPERVIGVRIPALRRLAGELPAQQAAEFLSVLPHSSYDENNLHGILIGKIKDYEECIAALDAFLPFVDNWATCDIISPRVFKKHLPELSLKIREWLRSPEVYTVRFGVEQLMNLFLDNEFSTEYPELVASVVSDEYYINMAVSWYFATALSKRYDDILPYLENRRLSTWTHNKAIQKAIESLRISDEQKAYLRELKVKPPTQQS